MTDVAVLGLQVDSRPVAAATSELNKLVPAAKAAETATGALEAAAKRLGISTQEMQGKVDKAKTGIGPLSLAADVAAKSTAKLSFEARNLSYQLVDVTQGVLMGQSAFQIFAQQGGQIAQVIATTPGGLGGLMRELGRSALSVITPMRLLGAGAVAAGVAAYAMNAAWKSSALELDNTSRAIGTTIGQLRGLERAAAVKGIEDFSKDAEKFAGYIYQARNGMGSLGDVLRANGERATDFNGTLQAAARIIGRAASDQQKLQLLQQMGLPATMEWVRFLSQGADAIGKAAGEATNLSAREQELVDKARKFDEGWSTAWRNFKKNALDAFVEIKAGIQDSDSAITNFYLRVNPGSRGFVKSNALGGGTQLTGDQAAGFYNAIGGASGQRSTAAPNAVDPQAAARGMALEQQRLALLGQTASVGQQVRIVELQIAQARASGVNITAREAEQLKELARQRALGTDQIRAQTDAYNIDAATVGMSIERAASYAAVQNRLNDARRNGQTLTAANVADIQREADAMGAAAAKADELRFEFDTFSGTMREFGANIRNGQNAWQAFGNAGANALGKIADRLMDMASKALWQAAFPGGGGGLLGLLGIGGGGELPNFGTPSFVGPLPSVNGNVFSSGTLSGFSNSVVTRPTLFPINDGPIRAFANGAGLMGEAGPEAIMPLTRGPDGKLGVRSQGGGTSSISIVNHYDMRGADPGSEARMKAYVDESSKQSVQQAVQAVQRVNANSGGAYIRQTR